MAVYFFDSSALVKRYVVEAGSNWVQSITDPAALNTIFIAHITGVEVITAITKRIRNGDVAKADGDSAIADFRYDLAHQYNPIEITARIIIQAMTLAEKHPLRGYDAVQLSVAVEVHTQNLALDLSVAGGLSMIFISADGDLNQVANAEGLTIEDPRSHH